MRFLSNSRFLAISSILVSVLGYADSPESRKLVRAVVEIVKEEHVLPPVLDDAFSKRLYLQVFRTFDPDQIFFTKSDVADFKSHLTSLDNDLNETGTIEYIELVHKRFVQRVSEEIDRVEALLAADPDLGAELRKAQKMLRKVETMSEKELVEMWLTDTVQLLSAHSFFTFGTMRQASGAIGRREEKLERAVGHIIEHQNEAGKAVKTGYINLPSFYGAPLVAADGAGGCASDVGKILEEFNSKSVDGVILDLRGNPGGLMGEARDMVAHFIGVGPVILVGKPGGKPRELWSMSEAIYPGPLMVLIDQMSASASELFAGAIQDYKRGVIVGGAQSFGKGSVQSPMDIGLASGLEKEPGKMGELVLTTAGFFLPSGRSNQMVRVNSDVVHNAPVDFELNIGEIFWPGALKFDSVKAADFKPFDFVNGDIVAELKDGHDLRGTHTNYQWVSGDEGAEFGLTPYTREYLDIMGDYVTLLDH